MTHSTRALAQGHSEQRRRMKVLLVAPRFFDAVYGERRAVMSAYKTAYALSEHISTVVVTAGPPPRYEKLSPTLSIYRLWDFYIPDPVNLGIAPGIFTALARIIRQEKPNVYLVNKHMFSTSFAAPFLRLLGKRVVLQTDTFPGINWFPRNPIVNVVMRLLAWTAGLVILKSANRVVLLHEGLVPVAKHLGLPYTVIHNGIDLHAFHGAKPASDIAKKDGDIFVCYSGRLESVKGYDDLLVVAAKLVKIYPRLKFFFVGGTEGREEIVRKFAGEQIIFTGHRKDIPSVLKRMDIFVLPSYSEGLPNALMEGMAAGCAPVASDVGGVKILLDDNAGLMFPPGNQEVLTKQLLLLIEDKKLRKTLGKKAAQRIKEKFDQDREIVKLLNLLKQYGNN